MNKHIYEHIHATAPNVHFGDLYKRITNLSRHYICTLTTKHTQTHTHTVSLSLSHTHTRAHTHTHIHVRQHSMCILATGEVLSWGCGKYGRLGHGSELNYSLPTVIDALAGVCVCVCVRERERESVCVNYSLATAIEALTGVCLAGV